MSSPRLQRGWTTALLWWGGVATGLGGETNAVPPLAVDTPSLTASLLRVAGALVLVIVVFLGAAWLFRNGQRLLVQKGRAPKLNVMEVKSLGTRHALYVVGYEDQRFLLSSSPAGIALLTHLPSAGPDAAEAPADRRPAFGETLMKAVARR